MPVHRTLTSPIMVTEMTYEKDPETNHPRLSLFCFSAISSSTQPVNKAQLASEVRAEFLHAPERLIENTPGATTI